MADQNKGKFESSDELSGAALKAASVQTEDSKDELEERVVCVNRNSKVVKGGRNFSFSALVVVGDHNGHVGIGFGKANENADAIRKGGEQARKHMLSVPMNGDTITHRVEASFGGAKIMIRPASAGTGVIAGGGMRHVLELAGIKDVLAKSLGAKNAVNVVKATVQAIMSLRTREQILEKRGVKAL